MIDNPDPEMVGSAGPDLPPTPEEEKKYDEDLAESIRDFADRQHVLHSGEGEEKTLDHVYQDAVKRMKASGLCLNEHHAHLEGLKAVARASTTAQKKESDRLTQELGVANHEISLLRMTIKEQPEKKLVRAEWREAELNEIRQQMG